MISSCGLVLLQSSLSLLMPHVAQTDVHTTSVAPGNAGTAVAQGICCFRVTMVTAQHMVTGVMTAQTFPRKIMVFRCTAYDSCSAGMPNSSVASSDCEMLESGASSKLPAERGTIGV